MSMTMTQKILAAHAEKIACAPAACHRVGDMVLGNDITAPVAIREFEVRARQGFDRDKIALVMDHFTPNKDIKAAEQCKICTFARKHNITNFHTGRVGVEHALARAGTCPGDLVIGADRIPVLYGALGAFSTGVGSTDMAYAMATANSGSSPRAIKLF